MKKILILFSVMLLFLNIVSSAPPITSEFVGDTGLEIQANVQSYYKINEGAEVHIWVFNKSTGAVVSSPAVSCEVELTDHNGTVVLSGYPTADANHFHMARPPAIVDSAETYGLTIVCNNSDVAGYQTAFFEGNVYGVGLTDGDAINFNFAMIFLMIFFLMSIVGIFAFKNPTGKLACYWIAHVLFVVGTFSVWQFNDGFNIAYVGLAGIFKILFWVSLTAMFPMILLSLAWIFYIHTMNDDIRKMMDRGMDESEAYDRAKKNRRRRK